MFLNDKFLFVFLLLTLNFLVVEMFDEQNDEVFEPMKRFLLGKKKTTTATTKSTAGAIAALITTSKGPTTSKTLKPSVTKSPSISSKDACGVISPCKNGGTCKTLSGGSFYCFCTQDYYGKTCDNKFITSGTANRDRSPVDHCLKKPCKNNGECVGLRTTFYCRCKVPFYGTTCEKKI